VEEGVKCKHKNLLQKHIYIDNEALDKFLSVCGVHFTLSKISFSRGTWWHLTHKMPPVVSNKSQLSIYERKILLILLCICTGCVKHVELSSICLTTNNSTMKKPRIYTSTSTPKRYGNFDQQLYYVLNKCYKSNNAQPIIMPQTLTHEEAKVNAPR